MAKKKIATTNSGQKLFFSVEVFNVNCSYDWRLVKTSSDSPVKSGEGASNFYEAIELQAESLCKGTTLKIKTVCDQFPAKLRVSIYRGTNTNNVTLIDKLETNMQERITTHQIIFE